MFYQIFKLIQNLFHGFKFSLANYNKKNLNIEALIDNYKDVVSKELKEANDKLDSRTADLINVTNKIKNLNDELDIIITAIKNAKKREANDETSNDIRLMKIKAETKLKTIKSYEVRKEHLETLVNEFRKLITDAKIQYEINLNELEIAHINHSMLDFGETMDNLNFSNIDKIKDVISGKTSIIQAKRVNDKILNRRNNLEISYNDVNFSKELEDLIGE